ncbi:hypothetical protein GWI33_020405 [Rhynchophorus ferrugineus]|uniref:Arrestin C-terminal-like domain-containing protein n=1 Tax=Rhynchophorus ferrugineus TaxID=354439 RepID=A0A834M3E9_RHYFE|nr:hypothetical protein GWI33_020405 [Rhynchophorus ferrugineus]
MFSNGKFKNVVAMYSDKESCPIHTGDTFSKTYTLLPLGTSTKNWIALEDTYTKTSSNLASTVCSTSGNPEDRNVFAIYVSYYVKVKLLASVMGGDVSLKLPFTLMHACTEFNTGTLTRVVVEINKTEYSTTTQPNLEPSDARANTENAINNPPRRPSTLEFSRQEDIPSTANVTAEAPKKQPQNLDEILPVTKEETYCKMSSKQNGAKNNNMSVEMIEIAQEEHRGFYNLKALCCFKTYDSS